MLPLPPAPIRIAVPLFSLTSLIVDGDSPKSKSYSGLSVPIPILPLLKIRSLSTPAVVSSIANQAVPFNYHL